jgi:methyl-accepting chemotaxis protein
MFRQAVRPDALKSLAVDAVSANIMVADAAYNIVSINSALKEFFSEAEAEIRRDLPNFRVAELIGKNIDVFHKNPAHQRRMLDGLASAHRATIRIGGRAFDLTVAPLKGGAGMAVEWLDASVRLQNLQYAAESEAIGRAQAIVEFELDGTIITANQNFLSAMGYRLEEIRGKHHRIFINHEEAGEAAYGEFWATLNRGEYKAGEFKRIGKGGREVWILASYNPILDEKGRPFMVVKFAIDITKTKLKNADLAGQIAAIDKSQAVIEFNMDGTILGANENFLHALGYSLAEIVGRHHSMFVNESERASSSYQQFWANLNQGKY